MSPVDTMASDTSRQLPKLTVEGSNWVLYKIRLTSLVGAKGLTRHLKGTARKPDPLPTLSSSPTSDQQKQYDEALVFSPRKHADSLD